MEPSKIVHLSAYRGRRDTRFRRTLALHCREPERIQILLHLEAALSLVGGDRGAVVWMDEYGPGLVHPHTLLDLASECPRRLFSPDSLRMAWDDGVPALLDLTESCGGLGRDGDRIHSTCAVSLGSEGFRSWFLVVDSLTPRPSLDDKVKGQIMFISGELASIILHRDLNPGLSDSRERTAASTEADPKPPGFPGWQVLGDIEGRQRDQDSSQRISSRFLVARAVRGVLEDELVPDMDSLAYQTNGIRRELGLEEEADRERDVWVRVLASLESVQFKKLLAALLEWGKVVEDLGHQNGALEIQRLAYDLAVAIGAPDAAVDAARFQAKAYRTLAEWDRAVSWYGVARRVAEEVGNPRQLAAVIDGMANTYRDRGNLPRARELLQEVMALGHEEDDRYALAIAHHDLMTVERLCGNMVQAIQHGWTAVQGYDSNDGSLKALFDLAGVLRETGELLAARDAYAVVADQLKGFEYRLMSLDALAFIAALLGDRVQYQALRTQMDGEGWEELSPLYQGQVLFYRGLSSRALGSEVEGKARLREALEYAEQHSLNWLIFDIEEALEEVPEETGTTSPTPAIPSGSPEPFGQEIVDVRQGLRELRESVAVDVV